jgi:phospholipid/cholesterol/gamma-HCH transport system ATP-binding protein
MTSSDENAPVTNRSGEPQTDEPEDTPSTPEVEFRDVSFSYDDRQILDQVSFAVKRGEILIILSASGGGKSTILKLILGLLKADAGQIRIEDEDVTNFDEDRMQPIRDRIGMVFQENALFDSLSVYDNVAFRPHELEVPDEVIDTEVRELLRFVDLEEDADSLPDKLSGGMRKRVALARALIGDPKLILFDEPTVGLDPPTSATICELMIKLRDLERVASIVVTHEMDIVKYLSTAYLTLTDRGEIDIRDTEDHHALANTRIMMLRNGREIFCGTEDELIASTNTNVHNFIAGTELIPDEGQGSGA